MFLPAKVGTWCHPAVGSRAYPQPAGRQARKRVAVVDSTNQYLLDRIAELHSGDACVAEYQQAGGAAGGGRVAIRRWYTCRCSGDWSRGRLRPWARLVIGMVMAEVLQRLGAADVRVKWPNDLYLNDRKLAGSWSN
ncbi:hypothetical protein M8494_35460 [Serratia ureilytica]